MAAFTPSGSAGTVTTIVIAGATVPGIANVSMPSAATEYSFSLPTDTKRFMIKLRGSASFQLAYETAAAEWLTVPAGNWYSEGDVALTGVTLYFQSAAASQVAEIVYWL